VETGFYKNLEKNFNNNVHYLIKDTSYFLKYNYLFFCLGIIFLWLIYNFYPGAFAGDTFYIFSDAYRNTVGNWHSPVFSRLWQLILFLPIFEALFG